MLGLTSITFRSLDAEKIIALVRDAGLDGIEWGGDIHVPPDGPDANKRAEYISAKTIEAGLKVLSYGSYYKLCTGQDFSGVLRTAHALKAPIIRVWAGNLGSTAADEGHYQKVSEEFRDISARAADYGIKVALEYHRGTLTDTCESAKKLIDMTNHKNAFLYWQPNPDLPVTEHYREIKTLLPRIIQVHVFQWEKNNVRRPLDEGKKVWQEYMHLLGADKNYIMEFVKDDSVECFRSDAVILSKLSAEVLNH
jgi:sugar phosphate isomerase/epimerase